MQIYLIGFMGVGKSTLGKLLSEELHIPFKDLDDEIVSHAGRSIPAIFEQHGQSHFRDIERHCLLAIMDTEEDLVLATGGGLPCHYNNIELMTSRGLTVYLHAAPAALTERLKRKIETRPMLKDHEHDLQIFVEQLLRERLPYYLQAQVKVDLDLQESASDNAGRVMRAITTFKEQVHE